VIALRLALRELRGGVTGLRLLMICLVLGVAAIAGVGSLAAAIDRGLADNGQRILGGDLAVQLTQRRATADERAALARLGPVSEVIRLRAMTGDGPDRVLAEVKAVDAAYPLVGALRLANGARLVPGSVAVAPALVPRIRGGALTLGQARLRVAGIIADEPDATGDGFGFGPRLLMRSDDLAATGLLAPGSLFRAGYRLRVGDPAAAARALKAALPATSWTVTDRRNSAPGTRQFIDRLGQFLTLVGLTALVVAGVGVGNGVAAYLAAKSTTIASLKAMGAGSLTIFASYGLQIGVVALAAVAAGAALGACVPWIIVHAAGDALPVPPALGLYPRPLATAATYGLLIALGFAVVPLVRARDLPAARLLRDVVEPGRWPGIGAAALVVAAAAGVTALAVGQSDDPVFAAVFIAAAAGLLVVLTMLAYAIGWVAQRLPRPRGVLLRLALGNLHRPGALTRQLVVALGLGLTLFATLSVIETNLAGQLDDQVPARAPSFFAIDIPTDGLAAFTRDVAVTAPGATLRTVPSLRGPVTAVNGVPVARLKVSDGAWILRGDRGLSYAAAFPEHNRLTAGRWWPADYAGPPLVSIDQDAATALGLHLGDTLTIGVLGVDITARIASFRKIDWRSFGFNFAILFAPGTLEGAPHSWMATVALRPEQERPFAAAVARDLPTASLVRVRDVIGQVTALFAQLSTAVRAAASVTVAAGIAVLIGALAAGRQARTYDAVLLKVLGATRGRIATAALLEYGALALIVAGLALALGLAAGWYVVTRTLQLEWVAPWGPAAATVGIGAAVTVLLGLAGSWAALSARPNAVLRTL